MKFKAKISPRTATETGGYACMPLRANVSPKSSWVLTTCPECGQECYETPALRGLKSINPRIKALCTKCALKKRTH